VRDVVMHEDVAKKAADMTTDAAKAVGKPIT
jgi:hypothetical protein